MRYSLSAAFSILILSFFISFNLRTNTSLHNCRSSVLLEQIKNSESTKTTTDDLDKLKKRIDNKKFENYRYIQSGFLDDIRKAGKDLKQNVLSVEKFIKNVSEFSKIFFSFLSWQTWIYFLLFIFLGNLIGLLGIGRGKLNFMISLLLLDYLLYEWVRAFRGEGFSYLSYFQDYILESHLILLAPFIFIQLFPLLKNLFLRLYHYLRNKQEVSQSPYADIDKVSAMLLDLQATQLALYESLQLVFSRQDSSHSVHKEIRQKLDLFFRKVNDYSQIMVDSSSEDVDEGKGHDKSS